MIESFLRSIRRDLFRARSIERGVRVAFYTVLLAGMGLMGVKLLTRSLPPATFLPFLAAVPLCAMVLIWVRGLSLRACAILVDRALGLEERVSTALDATGPLCGALRMDAQRSLAAADPSPLRRVRWPKESLFLPAAVPLLAAAWLLPAPSVDGDVDALLVSAARRERERIRVLLSGDSSPSGEVEALRREMAEIAERLAVPAPEAVRDARERLRRVEERAAALSSRADLSEADRAVLAALAAGAGASGQALSRALERTGRPPSKGGNPLPRAVVNKLGAGGGPHASDRPSEFVVEQIASRGAAPVEARRVVTRAMERHDWPSRYDTVVRNYFSQY